MAEGASGWGLQDVDGRLVAVPARSRLVTPFRFAHPNGHFRIDRCLEPESRRQPRAVVG